MSQTGKPSEGYIKRLLSYIHEPMVPVTYRNRALQILGADHGTDAWSNLRKLEILAAHPVQQTGVTVYEYNEQRLFQSFVSDRIVGVKGAWGSIEFWEQNEQNPA
jgi:hypothetical protein